LNGRVAVPVVLVQVRDKEWDSRSLLILLSVCRIVLKRFKKVKELGRKDWV
jgi:hypothetical protein